LLNFSKFFKSKNEKKITSIADEGRKTEHKEGKIMERNREAGLNMVSSKENFSFFMEAHYLLSKAKTPSHSMASLSFSLSLSLSLSLSITFFHTPYQH
jgi:hypothetical protein